MSIFVKFPVYVSVYCPGHGSANYSSRDFFIPVTRRDPTKLLISVRDGNPMCFIKPLISVIDGNLSSVWMNTPQHKYLRLITQLPRASSHRLFRIVSLWAKNAGSYLFRPIYYLCTLSLCSLGFTLNLHWCVFSQVKNLD